MSDLVAVDALDPLQRALYDRLTGDVTLMGLVNGVFDHVPEDQAYDYVTLGEVIETPDNRHDGYGRSVLAVLHVWSQARGYGPGLAIKARIVELLDHQALTVDGQHVVAVRFEQARTMTDPREPGDIRHIPIRFRIDVEQTESS